MMQDSLRTILRAVRDGHLAVEDAHRELQAVSPLETLPFATIDHHRASRTGFPEVIFCSGKTVTQVAEIAARMWERSGRLLATRADDEQAAAIRAVVSSARHNPLARTVSAGGPAPAAGRSVVVMTAGTSDLPVAEEAIETVRMYGEPVVRVADVGVAGIHRTLSHQETMAEAGVVVVGAGMEGALPSDAGGLTPAPVIAVPTSVGYGASFGGLTALLGMLNSCSPGVTVVNIDNGFGAGVAAARINALRRSGVDSGSAGDSMVEGEDACA